MFIKLYVLNSYRVDFVCFTCCLLVCNSMKSHGTKTKLALYERNHVQAFQLHVLHCLLQASLPTVPCPPPLQSPLCLFFNMVCTKFSQNTRALSELFQWLVAK